VAATYKAAGAETKWWTPERFGGEVLLRSEGHMAVHGPGVSQHPDHRWARPGLGSAAAAAHGDGTAESWQMATIYLLRVFSLPMAELFSCRNKVNRGVKNSRWKESKHLKCEQ
jgi:hypothetical protein